MASGLCGAVFYGYFVAGIYSGRIRPCIECFSGRERRFGKTSEQIQQEKIEKL